MKLVWSPETASKAYIDTVKYCELNQESGIAELISAMAGGWRAQLIVSTWSATSSSSLSTTVGLSIAARHTSGRHVIIVPDDRSRSALSSSLSSFLSSSGSPEILVGEPEEAMAELDGVDFLLLDARWRDAARFLRAARLGHRGAVLVCKNAAGGGPAAHRWRAVADGGKYRVVRTALLPVGQGLDIAHVAASGGSSPSSKPSKRRWVKHIDQRSGEEHVIRTS